MKHCIRLVSLATVLFLAIAACRKPRSEKVVAGCTDPVATNYDPSAKLNIGCRYKADEVAGDYCVTDTSIVFHHDLTKGWNDTMISHFTLHVKAVGHDSIDFDDNGLCLSCHRGNSGYFSMAADLHSYSWVYDAYYYRLDGSGKFSNGTFTYREMNNAVAEGSTDRWGYGVKQAP